MKIGVAARCSRLEATLRAQLARSHALMHAPLLVRPASTAEVVTARAAYHETGHAARQADDAAVGLAQPVPTRLAHS